MIEFLEKSSIQHHLLRIKNAVEHNASAQLTGTIIRITGPKLEVVGITAAIGTACKILVDEKTTIAAEVIGFSEEVTYLMAIEEPFGIKQGTTVVPLAKANSAKVGMTLLGRVMDATGSPIDKKGVIEADEYYPLIAKSINPLERKRIASPLDVGIRAINSLLTIGKGQRIGIFAGSGVGKSVLLGMMTKYTAADVVVVGLIGERGREVKEFIEENLNEEGLSKAVVVASPADTSPIMRVNGAARATAIAEYYRDKGFDVLLIVDSLTRFAQSQREISLSAGELPATKGYTPSVFAKLSQLVERSGNGNANQGSITAFYTVLVEGDESQDPIADHARSILDGHIFLSRELADAGHYPAIDIEHSISRVMPAVVSKEHLNVAAHFKRIQSAYRKNSDIINVGMYQSGADKAIDESIYYREKMDKFLKQSMHESADMQASLEKLASMFNGAQT